MRFGVMILPEHPWSVARRLWQRAEEYGFDHAWTYDHLRWGPLSDRPWYGLIPTLTAAATATSRIGLGPLVVNPRLRDPVVLAKEIMTIDDISGGRIICGIGAGAHDRDVLGRSPLPAQRFTEFVELTDLALRQAPTAYEGTHYSCHDDVLRPGCVQRPRVPLAIAATGRRGLRLAARLADTWTTYGIPRRYEPEPYELAVPVIKEQVRALEEACAETGRDPATINRLLLAGVSVGGLLDSAESFRDAAGVFADVGITDLVVHWPRPTSPYLARPDALDDIAAVLPALRR